MTQEMRLNFAKPRSPSGERGFALSEVLIAILIIGATLLTLLSASASSFSLQEVARQRLTAIGIANEVMERTRSLNYSVIQAGTAAPSLSDAAHVKDCGGVKRLMQCTLGDGFGEQIRSNSEPQSGCPSAVTTADLNLAANQLVPLRPNCTEYASNGVKYRAYVFVTRESTRPYRVTVIVDWPIPSPSQSVTLQSMVYPSTGCLGAVTESLVVGPCGTANLTTATIPGPKVTVSDASGKSVSFDLGGLSLAWDEPVAGQREVRASYAPPTIVGTTSVVTGISKGNPLVVRDSIAETAIEASGGTQVAGLAFSGPAPDGAASTWRVLAEATLGTYELALTWTKALTAADCGDSAPTGAAWFSCAQLDAKAEPGTSCFDGGTSPCIAARVKFPEMIICIRPYAEYNACSSTSLVVARLFSDGSIAARFTDTLRGANGRSFKVGVGYVSDLNAAIYEPDYPMTQVSVTGDNRNYTVNPAGGGSFSGGSTFAKPYMQFVQNGCVAAAAVATVSSEQPTFQLLAKPSSPPGGGGGGGGGCTPTTPTDCSLGSNYTLAYVDATATGLVHCYYGGVASAKYARLVTGSAPAASNSLTWSWYICTSSPANGTSIFTACPSLLQTLAVSVVAGETSIIPNSTGAGW